MKALAVVGWIAGTAGTSAASDLIGSSVRWDELKVTVGRKTLLHPSSGEAAPGRLLAVIGPSGAGKSTLLAALSGSVPAGGGKGVSGAVQYAEGGAPIRGDNGDVARLGQEVSGLRCKPSERSENWSVSFLSSHVQGSLRQRLSC